MVQLFDDNDVSVSIPNKPFIGQRYFYANAAEEARDADVAAEVSLKYPFPPANCDQAIVILQNLDDDIKTANEKLASGVSNKPVKRYLDSFLTVRQSFKNWVNAKQCVQTALNVENDAFSQQLQDALDNETASEAGHKSTDNLIIFGGLGLLLTVAIIIIVKKSKHNSSPPK